MKMIFATNNQHKADEIRSVLPNKFFIQTLKEAGIDIDIAEPYQTLEENAAEKASKIYSLTDTACFGEDTGLEVYALNNEPGVYSARYAGEEKLFQKNIDKLLQNLKNAKDRSARFRTVICCIINTEEFFFEGICEGKIINSQRGNEGFGYDSIFVPNGSDKTFAEMTLKEKNILSHRSKAVTKLVTFLNKSTINPQY